MFKTFPFQFIRFQEIEYPYLMERIILKVLKANKNQAEQKLIWESNINTSRSNSATESTYEDQKRINEYFGILLGFETKESQNWPLSVHLKICSSSSLCSIGFF